MSKRSKKADLPQLGETKRDVAVAWTNAGLNMIPWAGPILAQIISTIIPEQRTQRLEGYAKELDERLHGVEAALLTRPESVDIFETGAVLASRSYSADRIDQLARLVAFGMSGDRKAQIEAKRLLALMQSLDDDQVIILASYLSTYSDDREFYQKHAAILKPVGAHLESSREELDRETIHDLARTQLVSLGLLQQRFKKTKKGEVPEFDEKTGMLKATYRDLTPLGRLLLSRLGLAGPDEY